jgi:hypothetical protein
MNEGPGAQLAQSAEEDASVADRARGRNSLGCPPGGHATSQGQGSGTGRGRHKGSLGLAFGLFVLWSAVRAQAHERSLPPGSPTGTNLKKAMATPSLPAGRPGGDLPAATAHPRPTTTRTMAMEPQKPASSRKKFEAKVATKSNQKCEERAAFSHLPLGEGLVISTAISASYYQPVTFKVGRGPCCLTSPGPGRVIRCLS